MAPPTGLSVPSVIQNFEVSILYEYGIERGNRPRDETDTAKYCSRKPSKAQVSDYQLSATLKRYKLQQKKRTIVNAQPRP